MAGTNDFKAFATDANANVTSQEEWETLTALKKGFSSGKASSAQVSKALRQPSTMAAVLGQFIANAELDALDDGDVDGLVAKLATAITTNLGIKELMIGWNQAWTVFSTGRQTGVTYTNSTGKPIQISVSLIVNATDAQASLYINGALTASVACSGFPTGQSTRSQLTAIIPSGGTYLITSGTAMQWGELR